MTQGDTDNDIKKADRDTIIRTDEGLKFLTEAVSELKVEVSALRRDLRTMEKEVTRNSVAKRIGHTFLYILSMCGLTFVFNQASHLIGKVGS